MANSKQYIPLPLNEYSSHKRCHADKAAAIELKNIVDNIIFRFIFLDLKLRSYIG